MLLEFRTKNFKSFKNELVFSMIPAPKQKGLDYSILKENIENSTIKALPTSVIYGTNSSGKTTIISAMEVLKNIILKGNIKNNSQSNSKNIVVDNLELIPNKDTNKNNPVDFYLKFIEDKYLFEYKISLDLGYFGNKDFNRKILEEQLSINGNLIFKRKDTNIEFFIKQNNIIKETFIEKYTENEKSILEIAKNNINREELFLTNSFKSMFSQILVAKIINWLTNKFRPIFMSNTLISSPAYDLEKTKVFKSKILNDVAKIMGTENDIIYISENDKPNKARMVSLIDKAKIAVPSVFFESYGTFRFLNIFPIIYGTLSKGGILIIDEFDNSLHPNVVMSIIKIFHNDEINKHKAQLIFNTHNPIFLNSNLFRRDEIKFVEKTDETNESELYSLSDFGTDGKDGVRKGSDYMKHYFINKYGAIKNIDFTDIFKNLLIKENHKYE